MRLKISNWLFRHLFPAQWEHMGHLVDDVIRLEAEKRERELTREYQGFAEYSAAANTTIAYKWLR